MSLRTICLPLPFAASLTHQQSTPFQPSLVPRRPRGNFNSFASADSFGEKKLVFVVSVLWHLAIPVTQKRGREDTSAGTVLLRPSQEGSFPASHSYYIESVFGTYIIPSLESKVTDDVTIWRIFVTHLISVSCDCFLSLRFYLLHRSKSNDSKAKVSPGFLVTKA